MASLGIIGVCGRKGGSGKTTTAVHLAAQLRTLGLSVALIDCDAQGSATHWSRPGKLPVEVQHRPLDSASQIGKWKAALLSVPVDYLVLDSPPHLEAALGGVIGLSDLAVIPCGPSGLDLIATAETVKLVRDIRQARGDGKPYITLVPNRVDTRTASGKELEAALADLGEDVAPAIHSRIAFADAFNRGEWVGEYTQNSPAHVELQQLASHVLAQLRKANRRKGSK